MRKWAQAYADSGMGREQVASLDVTDESDGGLSVMADFKKAYGSEAKYEWEFCHHDEGEGHRPCESEQEI